MITAFISPFNEDRALGRIYSAGSMNSLKYIWDTPIEECERRDPKGLYKKARKGELKNFTGIDSEYEIPKSPEITIDTVSLSIEECADHVISYLKKKSNN